MVRARGHGGEVVTDAGAEQNLDAEPFGGIQWQPLVLIHPARKCGKEEGVEDTGGGDVKGPVALAVYYLFFCPA